MMDNAQMSAHFMSGCQLLDGMIQVPASFEAQRPLGHKSICDITHTLADAYAAQSCTECSFYKRCCICVASLVDRLLTAIFVNLYHCTSGARIMQRRVMTSTWRLRIVQGVFSFWCTGNSICMQVQVCKRSADCSECMTLIGDSCAVELS